MIKSAKRKEKIRKLWSQGYGEKNICAMEGISPEDLREILEEPCQAVKPMPSNLVPQQEPNPVPAEYPRLILTDVHLRILKALAPINTPRSAAALSGQLAVATGHLQGIQNSLQELGLIDSTLDAWARKYPAYRITHTGLQVLQQGQVSA